MIKAAEAAFIICNSLVLNLRRGGFLDRLCRHRPRILALGRLVAIDELDHRDGGVVAVAEARLHDAAVAAVALLVARSKNIEELLDHRDVADLRDRLPAGMQAAALAEGDEL